jgi:hypothetical protein
VPAAHDTIGAIKADAITGIERAAEFSALKDARISALNGLNEPWWKAVLLSRKMTPSSRFARFEEAADLQDSLPYTEPPFWYYPLRKTLATALGACEPARRSGGSIPARLERAPNNGWSYYGHVELGETPMPLAKQRPSSRKPGSATAHCCGSRSFGCRRINRACGRHCGREEMASLIRHPGSDLDVAEG